MELQYLVTAVSGPLPDLVPAREYFEHQHRGWEVCVDIVSRGEAYLLALTTPPAVGFGLEDLPGALDPSVQTLQWVDGHHVQVDLVLPDVYGCDVTVGQRHVQVHVGHDVITRITRDTQWRDSSIDNMPPFRSDAVSVYLVSTGQIVVKYMPPTVKFWKWRNELSIINMLIDLLSPFQALFRRGPLPVRDRCLAKCSSRSEHSLPSTDTDDCHIDAVIKLDTLLKDTDSFLPKMRTTYPGLQLAYDTDRMTLALSGRDDTVEKATKDVLNHVRSVFKDYMILTGAEVMMMENTDAQNWFQQSLDRKGNCCAWELTSSSTEGRHSTDVSSQSKHLKVFVSNTDPQSSIDTFKRAFESCFQTCEVPLSHRLIPSLQSDSWKLFVADLQTTCEDRIPPVLTVGERKVIVCDVASNICQTRRALLDFFDRYVIESNPVLFEDSVTEVITELQPWQMKLLTMAQVKGQLPAHLQQTVTVDFEMKTVYIHAPDCMVNNCCIAFWSYVASLSQLVIPLTAASTQLLQTSDMRERAQSELDEDDVCDWHVQQGRLVIEAHNSCKLRLERFFRSEIETTQQADQSLNRQQDDRQLQTDENGATAMRRELLTNDHLHQSADQQTDDIHMEDKQTQTEIEQEDKESHADNKEQNKEVQTDTWEENKEVQTDVWEESREVEAENNFKGTEVNPTQTHTDGASEGSQIRRSTDSVTTKTLETTRNSTLSTHSSGVRESSSMGTELGLTANGNTRKYNDVGTNSLCPQNQCVHPLPDNANGSASASSPSLNSVASSSSSFRPEEEQMEVDVQLPPETNSRGLRPDSSARLQGASRDPDPQQPGISRRPHVTGPPAPRLLEDPLQTLMISGAGGTPAQTSAHCPSDQGQSFRNPDPHINPPSTARPPEAHSSAGMSLHSSRPPVERLTNPRSCQHHQGFHNDRRRVHQRSLHIMETHYDELTDFSGQEECQLYQNAYHPVPDIATFTANSFDDDYIRLIPPYLQDWISLRREFRRCTRSQN